MTMMGYYTAITFFMVAAQIVSPVLSSRELNTTEAFFIPISEQIFNNSDRWSRYHTQYRASLLSMPDLPKWMTYTYSRDQLEGFIYGVPRQPGTLYLEVIATDKATFKTSRKVYPIKVSDKKEPAKFEVEIKFTNLNVDDVFLEGRLEKLVEIFQRWLWRTSREVYITMVGSAVEMGARRPISPKEKDGVVVRLGSTAEFSKELLRLEREVQQIRNRDPCPKDYKKTTAERYFREENFITDWCGFRLYSEDKQQQNEPAYSPILLTSDDFSPPLLMPTRQDLFMNFMITVIVPSATAVLLYVILCFLVVCRKDDNLEKLTDMPSVEMVQYATIHRASDNLRVMANKRDGPYPGSTPSLTVPPSYTSSPAGTLTRAGPTSYESGTLNKTRAGE